MRKLAHGFTLIELLVVISIIGLLATLVAANLNAARSRARDAERKSDIKNISTALRIYYNDTPTYPDTFSFGAAFKNASGTITYMEMVPNDPLYSESDATSPVYVYTQTGDGDGFTLKACLENASDPQGITASGFTVTCTSGKMFQISQ